MRALLRDIPDLVQAPGSKKARIFSKVELLVITVVSVLEQRYGLKRNAIKIISPQLRSSLQKPREVDRFACLVVVVGENQVSFSQITQPVPEGLVVPLAPIFNDIDSYLGATVKRKQLEISFGSVS